MRGCTKGHGEEIGRGREGLRSSEGVEGGCAGDAVVIDAVHFGVPPGNDGWRDALTHVLVGFLAGAGEAPVVEAEVVDAFFAVGEGAGGDEVDYDV